MGCEWVDFKLTLREYEPECNCGTQGPGLKTLYTIKELVRSRAKPINNERNSYALRFSACEMQQTHCSESWHRVYDYGSPVGFGRELFGNRQAEICSLVLFQVENVWMFEIWRNTRIMNVENKLGWFSWKHFDLATRKLVCLVLNASHNQTINIRHIHI